MQILFSFSVRGAHKVSVMQQKGITPPASCYRHLQAQYAYWRSRRAELAHRKFNALRSLEPTFSAANDQASAVNDQASTIFPIHRIDLGLVRPKKNRGQSRGFLFQCWTNQPLCSPGLLLKKIRRINNTQFDHASERVGVVRIVIQIVGHLGWIFVEQIKNR